ncbi:sigma-70 family RNA polymerase sigma factor [Nonomuraea sp. NPDC050790]|uniref:sigma-70 family RNA polymerase sigma factor n=1 Tax=Nonomuraea sp. NPDC050790 TaxID=3364371 RepID=UPI00379243A0
MRQSDEHGPATRVFADHRELVFSIVYNMLGSVADTEDVLQETWVSWAGRYRSEGGEPVENVRGYLVRVAVNHALARQADVRRRRETYVGPWLPEPLVTADDAADAAVRTEAVSMALMVVLETLNPMERAVFVLFEVFGYSHVEIAEIVGRNPAAVRQIAHRARTHVQARRPRHRPDPDLQRAVTERFVAAGLGGDLDAFLEILAPEVTLWADGGGKARAAGPRPVHGRDKVADLLINGFARPLAGTVGIRDVHVNGEPAAVVMVDEKPFLLLVVDLLPGGDRIGGIYVVTNPDKLLRLS